MTEDPDRLPFPPRNEHPDIEVWVDEQIWGHRIYGTQSPWLVFLEFLTVAEACRRENRLLDETGQHHALTYKPRKRLYLRNILFNSEMNASGTDEAGWKSWLGHMNENAQAVPDRDFSYLKRRFHSFEEFAGLITLLRASRVESDTNKRWSSRFVFPFGENAVYEDLEIKQGNTERQYIYFGRSGELLYLMLCRSGLFVDELRHHISDLLKGDNRWNHFLKLLEPDKQEDLSTRGKCYLPYSHHSSFDRLAEDWLSIFRLNLPGFDSLEHLVRLGGFHLLLYQLNIAADLATPNTPPYIIAEIVAPKKTLVRELSSKSYLQNNGLSTRAVEEFISQIERLEEWNSVVNQPGSLPACREILKQRLRILDRMFEEDFSTADPVRLIEDLKMWAMKRHQQQAGNTHRSYGRDIGLVSKRGTNKLRYAPNDAFLKTLVLANVEKRMELGEFLHRLYDRYGLVFEDKIAEQVVLEDYDKSAFKKNAKRLELRFSSLGMLRRLADGCAYIENSYRRSK